jgi:superoxide dismutase, Cu-Zn family
MHRSLCIVAILAGCKSAPAAAPEASKSAVPAAAGATIEARSGSTLAGEATFTEVEGGTRIVVTVRNAAAGTHAVHIHEKGDCSDPEAKSAGPHFNPDGHAHGAPTAQPHHAGDLGNMEVAADGTGTLEIVAAGLAVAAGPRSVVGRAIVVHEKPDDFVSQPAGNAGARIGCGAIAR